MTSRMSYDWSVIKKALEDYNMSDLAATNCGLRMRPLQTLDADVEII